jgi:hypothetical protein
MELLNGEWLEKFFYLHFLPLCRDDNLHVKALRYRGEYAGA